MLRTAGSVLFWLLLFSNVVQATLVTVTFDEAGLIGDTTPPPGGSGSPTILTNQLAYLGVTFSVPDPAKGVAYIAGPGDVNGTIGDGFVQKTLAVNTLPLNEAANATTLSISFLDGTTGNSISLDVNDTENSVLLSLFDGSMLVEQVPWVSVTTYQHIGFTYAGHVTRLDIFDGTAEGGDGDGFIIDNLRFDRPEAPVPEPASFMAVGLGLAFLAGLGAKSKGIRSQAKFLRNTCKADPLDHLRSGQG